MFDFIDETESVSWGTKTIFIVNRSILPHETRSFIVFHMPKAKPSRFSLKTLRFDDDANLWNQFFHGFLYKEPNLTKAKLKKLLQMHFLGNSASLVSISFLSFAFLILMQPVLDFLYEF